MLDVRFLGEASIVADGDIEGVVSARALEILAYLVCNAGVPHQRRRLASLLWPDSEEAQGRTNLRRELHNLRAAIRDDPSLAITASTLTWLDRPTCRVDVRVFESERAAAAAADANGDDERRQRHAAAALDAYRGDLLPGVFEEWVLDARASMLRGCVELCDTTVAAARAESDLPRALEVAHRRVRLAPLEETGYRTLIELQIAAGDRAAAVATYQRCIELFDRELGVSLDATTVALIEHLLHPPDTSGEVVSASAASGQVKVALVGRSAELDDLIARWRRADAGERGAVVVCGGAGVGKSRLVAELGEFARAEGAVVATSRSFAQSASLALAPVADWLRSTDVKATLDSLDPVWRTEVDRLLPAERLRAATHVAADVSASSPVADSWARLRFFEGLARALLHSGRPTLLILDDLQWCDQETVSWLTFLLEFSRDARLMVAATARPGALGDSREVASAIRVLKTSSLVDEVDLAPLDALDTATLAARLRGSPLSAADDELLHAATGGYPLFIVEATQGRPGQHSGVTLTTDVDDVLRRRLDETSAEAQEVARLAAAVGRDFSLDLLLEASDLDSETLVDTVDELWRGGIFVEHGDGYDFSHDLLRDAAYSSVSSARRWLLHRRLAQGLELLHAGRVDAVAAQLADQYRRGGRPDRALPYYRRAADVAASVYANAEALRQHERCIELIGELPEGRDRDVQELDVLQAMSEPMNALLGYASPVLQRTLERSITLSERLGRPDMLVRNLVGLFAVRFVQGYTAESHEFSSRALALSAGDPELSGQAHFAFAGSASSLGMLHLAVEHFDIATSISPVSVPLIVGTRPEVHAQAWSAHSLWLLGEVDAATARADGAVAHARQTMHPYTLCVALSYAAVTTQFCGDLELLRNYVDELRALCRRHEFAYYAEWGLILDGWVTGGDRGLKKIRLGIRSLRGQGAYARMPYWLSLLADAHSQAGQSEQARAILDAAHVAAEQRDDRWWLPEVLRRRAALEQGLDGVPLLEKAVAVASSQSSLTLARRCEADLGALGVRAHLRVRERSANT